MDGWWFEDDVDDDCGELPRADSVYDWDRFGSAVVLDNVDMNTGKWKRKEHYNNVQIKSDPRGVHCAEELE